MMPLTIENALHLALQHHQAGRLREAEQLYRQILARQPGHASALHFLGLIAHQAGKNDVAVDLMRQAIAIAPDYADAHNNLARVLQDRGDLDESIAELRRAVALGAAPHREHSNLVCSLHFHPHYDANAIAAEHRVWNKLYAAPLRRLFDYPNDRAPDRRLRIGYVSPDFRDHVIGRNLLPLFRRHDHQQFEVICYSNMRRGDELTGEFQKLADDWQSIVGLSDEDAAVHIQQDRIDILVDLSLHAANNRLLVFARKPAPVQVTFVGYPGSTGLTAVDYRLSDPFLDPPGMDESIYSEKTIRLPESFWCYDPIDAGDIPVNSLPALEAGFVTFGCLNRAYKLNDGILALWAQVLGQVANSRLLLRAPEGSHRMRTLDRLCEHGIAPARVEFIGPRPLRAYLEQYHRIDLGLDSFPYNGHTTSLDSFWMGVPVVTLVGQTAVSRGGWCQLSNLGLPELAGNTPDEFVRTAVALAHDLPRLGELRRTLRARMERSPLMDAAKFAGNVEAAYRRIWRSWLKGLPSAG